MGKLEHETHIHHFSHPHVLELCNLESESQFVTTTLSCSGCKLQISGYMYTCRPCNFTLHVACTKFAQLITHPSHPNHHLSLLPTSTYPGGHFNCDACNRRGDGFSYHCKTCDFDLHVTCASKPLSINNQFHPNHPLQLTFLPPYEAKGFSCDICRKIGAKQWLYSCVGCEFDVHLDCATATPRQTPIQHHHSFSGAPVVQQQLLQHHHSLPAGQPQQQLQQYHSFPVAQPQPQLQHHHSFPAGQPEQQMQRYHSFPVAQPQPQLQVPLQHHHSFPGVAATGTPVVQPNYYTHSSSTGGRLQNNPSVGGGNGTGGGIMSAVIQGLLEGAAQQVVQTMM